MRCRMRFTAVPASPEGDNLFLVGDLKQSIYRFRQAEPEIFRAKLGAWPALPGAQARLRPPQGHSGSHGMIALDANFRSAPQVVEGINFFFEQLMTPQLGDTAYGDGQRLVCGAPGEYAGSVEVCFQAEDSAETEAAWAARRILTWYSRGRWCGMAVHCGRCGTRTAASCCLPGPISRYMQRR